MNCCTGFKRLERNLPVLHSNFEMETSHVVTHMIFHAITADQNARIRVLLRRVSGKSTGKSVSFRGCVEAKTEDPSKTKIP